jgi:beta-ribofuranosylaminobenzene 5'-phosphate synthase
MKGDFLRDRIQEIEAGFGPLSSQQIILLLTDGSVTTLLEAICGEEVAVRTLSQNVIPADVETADALEVKPGALVNHRVVELVNSRTNEVLIYAVSDTPLERLEPDFKDDLMRADIPIGKIIRKHEIEVRREILDVITLPVDVRLAAVFGLPAAETLLSRKYRIIRRGMPFMLIREIFPLRSFTVKRVVRVSAPSRIHIALIDLHGGLGRVDGGIGIALATPRTVLELRESPQQSIKGGDEESRRRVQGALTAVREHLGTIGNAAVSILTTPPGHVGLGAGTALSLAAAKGICELNGIDVPVQTLSRIVGRGGTSGIGTAAFDTGGFILDGGHSFGPGAEKREFKPSSESGGINPAPVIARHPFPPDWKILLVIPPADSPVSGQIEKDIFRGSCPVPRDEVREICHEVIMRLLPGVAGSDLDLFAAAVNRIQEIGFKRVELARQKPVVHHLIRELREAGAACTGLSSFGPAVYAITSGDLSSLERRAREILGPTGGTIIRTGGDNSGSTIQWMTS